MYNLTVQHFFEAAHQLPDTEDLITKGCANLHGHTYHIEVGIEASKNTRNGMVVDFKAIKDIINILDHRFINDVFKEQEFCKLNYNVEGPPQKGEILQSTAENIARFIFERIDIDLKITPAYVKVGEGYKGPERTSYVTYKE